MTWCVNLRAQKQCSSQFSKCLPKKSDSKRKSNPVYLAIAIKKHFATLNLNFVTVNQWVRAPEIEPIEIFEFAIYT